jgi:ribosomal RNA-processing protein 7
MSTAKPKRTSKQDTLPTTVGEFTILPLTLPKLPGLPLAYSDAKHYLYIRAHAPSKPTPTSDRSLFIANVPFDASENNIRQLFADQLGGSRVESVEFGSAIPGGTVHKRFKVDKKKDGEEDGKGKGRKRKRDEDVVAEGIVEDEESALPRTWSGDIRKSGGSAVVIFVDRESRRGAEREVKRCVKEGRQVRWMGGEKGLVGVERECPFFSYMNELFIFRPIVVFEREDLLTR